MMGDLAEQVEEQEVKSEIQYSDDQSAALESFESFLKSDDRYMSLIGPAGSGKSTIVKAMLETAKNKMEVNLSAPTHKAAQNLREIAGKEVRTIHSMLSVRVKRDYATGEQYLDIDRDRFNPWDFHDTLTVIDESSMVGIMLMELINEVAHQVKARFLFVGDSAQLRPIGEDLSIAVDKVQCPWEVAELTTVHRQARDNPVLAIATDIRTGSQSVHRIDQKTVGDQGVFVLPADKWRELLIERCMDQTLDNRAVSFTNAYSDKINSGIRAVKYSDIEDLPPYVSGELMVANSRVAKNDTMLIENNEEVTIKSVSKPDYYYELEVVNRNQESVKCRAMPSYHDRKQFLDSEAAKARRNKSWEQFYKLSDIMADLRPAFSGTVHKAQGSTYNDVFFNLVELNKCYDQSELRRLLYVALTRASNSVYVTQ